MMKGFILIWAALLLFALVYGLTRPSRVQRDNPTPTVDQWVACLDSSCPNPTQGSEEARKACITKHKHIIINCLRNNP